MNKVKIIIYLLLPLTIATNSCKKFLDKKSSTGFVSPNTLDDLQGLLDNGANVMNRNLTPSLGEASSDDQFVVPTDFEWLSTTEQDFYLWRKTSYYFDNDWSKSYAAVYYANFCLEGLEKVQRSTANATAWDNVRGSALFYRSYNYLNLLWNFSKAYNKQTSKEDLGIVLRLGADFNVPSVRANVEDCYQKVIEDTKTSITLLPSIGTHVYRPSKCAAYGLLARTYLSMREYDSAYKYASLALSLKHDLLDYNEIDVTPYNPFPVFNKEIIFYTEMFPVVSIVGLGLTDTLLYNSYQASDLRKGAFFSPSSDYYYSFKGSYSSSGFFTGIATDELYLTRAECSARMGDRDASVSDLNELLKNRYQAPYVPLDIPGNEDLLQVILQERRKELLRRGLRWMDIKRLNMEGVNINLVRNLNGQLYQLNANDNYFALPLPADVINVSGMQQNP